jgi:hypothetical protein
MVYLEHRASQNTARVRADFTPANNITSMGLAEGDYALSYAIQFILDDIKEENVGNGTNSGLVHYNRTVAAYLQTLPFCSSKFLAWDTYQVHTSMENLYQLVPCKTFQKERDNFLFLHAARLNTGIDSLQNTVIAMYKTPAGRNRIADMQKADNMIVISLFTDVTLFGTVNIPQPVLSPLLYDFSSKITALLWRLYANSFAIAQNFDLTSIDGSSRTTLQPYGLKGFYSSTVNASITYKLPAVYNAIQVRFANAFSSGRVVLSICRTRDGIYACEIHATTDMIFQKDVVYSTRYMPGDTMLLHEEGSIGQNLRITLIQTVRTVGDISLTNAEFPISYDFDGLQSIPDWFIYTSTFGIPSRFDAWASWNAGTINMLYGVHSPSAVASITYILPNEYDTVEGRVGNLDAAGSVGMDICSNRTGIDTCTRKATAHLRSMTSFKSNYFPGDRLYVAEFGGVFSHKLRIVVSKSVQVTQHIVLANQSIFEGNTTLTLIDTLVSSIAESLPQDVGDINSKNVTVVNGLCADSEFAWVHASARPCNLSTEWDPADAVEDKSMQTIKEQLPCFLTQMFGTFERQVTYFSGLSPSGFYATYQNAVQNTAPGFYQNVVANVSSSLIDIMRTGDMTTTLLRFALTSNVVKGTLQYDATMRENVLWQHLHQTAQHRSCNDILSHMTADINNIEEQYRELAGVLKRDGPCAPEFEGFDHWQNPSNVEFSGRSYSDAAALECVLVVSTAQEDGREAIMAFTRQYISTTMVPLPGETYTKYEYGSQFVTPALVHAAVVGSIPASDPTADYLLSTPKLPVVYDFEKYGGTTRITWQNYAFNVSFEVRNLLVMRDDGVGSTDNRGGFEFFMRFVLPLGYNKIFVRFQNRAVGGIVTLRLNSVVVATATGLKNNTYEQFFLPGSQLEIIAPSTATVGQDLFIQLDYENANANIPGVKMIDLTTGFCNVENLLHVPKANKNINSRVLLWTTPKSDIAPISIRPSSRHMRLERESVPDNNAAWVRLDMQYVTRIEQIKIEFDGTNAGRALKYYEVQIGNQDTIDANPIYAQYAAGDNERITCSDCQPILASVDADLIVWLQFDDPTFIGKDSSIYQRHASIMSAARNQADQSVMYDVPTQIPLNSTHGPYWGSLLLNNFRFLQVQAFSLKPTSDFTISFWFVGVAPPADVSARRERIIMALATADGSSFIRMEQSWYYPSGITTFISANQKYGINRYGLRAVRAQEDRIFSQNIQPILVDQWNHYLLSISSVEGSAKICINRECFFMQDGQTASDGITYTITGFEKVGMPIVLSTRMNAVGRLYCQYPYLSLFECYSGQLDDFRFYQRQLTEDETEQISAKQILVTGTISAVGIGQSPVRALHPFDKPAFFPWMPSGSSVVIQHAIPYVQARYIFLKFPLCDSLGHDCNTEHVINITRVQVHRQQWFFNMSSDSRQASAWSWSGDTLPNVFIQQPWKFGRGLCFGASTMLLSHRRWMGLPDFSVTMDLKKVSAVTGLTFTYVAGSEPLSNVLVYYDIEPLFLGNHAQMVDLSLLGTSFTNMTFANGPLRMRYVRIVLQKYTANPPCIQVVPIICSYFCVGCCQQVHPVDPMALPVLSHSINDGTAATVWQTGDKMCRCVQPSYNATVVAFVFERIFATFQTFDAPSSSIGMYECHLNDSVLSQPYDGKYSRHVLGHSANYTTGYKSLFADGIIDIRDPQPIIIQQGVPTVIDWSLSRIPVVIAHKNQDIHNCANVDIMDENSQDYQNNCHFVDTDYDAGITTILVPDTYATFADLKYFFRLQGSTLGEPVPIVAVHVTSPSFPSLFYRPAFSCTKLKEIPQVDAMCPCDTALNHFDAYGMAIDVSLVSIVNRRIFKVLGELALPVRFTHYIHSTKYERIRQNDHLFAHKPRPLAIRTSFFRNDTSTRDLDITGEFVGADIDRPVLRNRFTRLPSIGVLYKDVSYVEDPWRCDRKGGSQYGNGWADGWHADVCGSKFIAYPGGYLWYGSGSYAQVRPLLNTVRPLERNRWRALELQTEESYSGPGGSGFVQHILSTQDWIRDTSIHITPQVGINVRYPTDSPRPFINDDRKTMFHNYDDGTAVHMTVFVSSKKLNVSSGNTDWDWITCGALTQKPVVYPPRFFSISVALAPRYTHGPETLMNDPVTLPRTTMPDFSPKVPMNLNNSWHTAFASNNMWVSQGGFLPNPPICWDSNKDNLGISAQSPKGMLLHENPLVVTKPENTPCRLGQLEFPGPKNAAVKAGYSRCNITKSLEDQKMPCMYTLGDVLAKYKITARNFIDMSNDPDMDLKSVFSNSLLGDLSLVKNYRTNDDIFTQKIIYGVRDVQRVGSAGYYVCHPQYNNWPENIPSETTTLRPDIACHIPQSMAMVNVSMIQDCVCGIITKTVTFDNQQKMMKTFIRVIPQTKSDSQNVGTNAVPIYGFVTELSEEAVKQGDVLSIGIMTVNSSINILGRKYFASDPGVAGMYETAPSMPAQYDMCSAQIDPDNTQSANTRNPYILDGIVVPLGKTMNIDQPVPDCCNFIRPHARVIALENADAAGRSRVGYIEAASATELFTMMKSDLWLGARSTSASKTYSSTFPWCNTWAPQPSVGIPRNLRYNPSLDTNTYPCAGRQIAEETYAPNTPGFAARNMMHVFDKVYIKTRGWILVVFNQLDRECFRGFHGSTCSGRSGQNRFDWKVEHVRQPSRFVEAHSNYNIPNDAHMWKIGDLLFGGINGVGSCAARCPSSGEYDNIKGTIQWKPKITPTAVGQEYWLYTMFSVGESKACKFFNCDEAALYTHMSQFSDVVPNTDGLHPLTFFEGTEVSAFVPYNPPFVVTSACFLAADTSVSTGSLTFRLTQDLFGSQRITDFDFCEGCINSVCQYDVMPCRWRSTVDIKWSFYMAVFHPSADMPLILTFHIVDAAVIAVEYTNTTDFEGHTFKMVEIPKMDYETSAIRFNRTEEHFLDLGSRVFNIASNGGFTGVAVVKFTDAPGEGERIFDFGKGPDSDNILITRDGITDALGFSIRNGNADCIVWTLASVAPQDTWLTVVATYKSMTKTLEIRVGNIVKSTVCSIARTNRVVTNTFVGRSNWVSNAYLNGMIAGLYAIDTFLSETQITDIINIMFTNVSPDLNININPVGYFINGASLMTYKQTPSVIPALVGASQKIFTTPMMECATASTAASRRLLTSIHQDDKRNVQVPVKTSRRVQRIHPLPQHGRKRHGVYNSLDVYTQPIISASHTPPHSNRTTRGVRKTKIPQSGPRRMLFSTATGSSNDLEEDLPTVTPEKFAAIAREITSVNNNRQVTDLLCGSVKHGNTCDMLSVNKEVSITEFCLRESSFMTLAATGIRAQLFQASSSAVTEILITSIARPGAYYKCKPTAIRRLLQTETILITYVTRASSNYFVNRDILLDTGFSSLQRLTSLEGTKLAICTSISIYTQASVLVSVDVSDKDRICNFENALPTSSSLLQILPNTTSPNLDNTSVVQHRVSIMNQSQGMGGSSAAIVDAKTSIPIYAIVLVIVGTILVFAFCFCMVTRHNYSRLSETEHENAHSAMFIQHHAPIFVSPASGYAHGAWS